MRRFFFGVVLVVSVFMVSSCTRYIYANKITRKFHLDGTEYVFLLKDIFGNFQRYNVYVGDTGNGGLTIEQYGSDLTVKPKTIKTLQNVSIGTIERNSDGIVSLVVNGKKYSIRDE